MNASGLGELGAGALLGETNLTVAPPEEVVVDHLLLMPAHANAGVLPYRLTTRTDATAAAAEARIHPYQRDGNASDGKTRKMNLHELPWPKDELEALGDSSVRLRVTLSCFIEPNPSCRGRTGR